MVRICAIILLAFLFSSCASKSDGSLAIFKSADEGFLYSNDVISNSNNVIYHDLHEKLLQPESAKKAAEWEPKAMFIKEKTAAIFDYLDSLITALKKEAGLRLENIGEIYKEVYNENDVDAASRLFINNNIGEKVFEKLQKYKNDIFAVDPELNAVFGSNSIIISREFEQSGAKQKDFAKTFFDGVPAVAAVAMLRKLENNVRVFENKFIAFCNAKVASYSDSFTFFSTLIGQSANVIKAGDEMQIQAGVGAFSVLNKPIITINDKIFKTEETNGVALYKFKTSRKPGKYSIPVTIEYTDDIGKRQVVKEKLEYTVIQ